MWISLLAVPTLMTFTLDNEGHITYLNVIGLVYSIWYSFPLGKNDARLYGQVYKEVDP